VVVLGIGDGRLERLLDVAGDALAREGQIGQRGLNLLAADDRRDQVELLRADTKVARYGAGFVVCQSGVVWTACPWLLPLRLLVGPWP
jgi:hypothetical protein